ncbi:TonB-dependent receptor [Thiomicrorhabdus sp. 6S2-11]|uniref:TonB-dependent receptor n=1 Tax=Thiomicrorhabdus marina TaxID=2818442 RepID=A0ABS3Q4M0_9GAMM|nr:TonB-dependent receptor [Thiomicrorhabdus marina]MBO1927284.1 TonB-dependent receptor [Thiomicrorhabdus marina]
MRLNKLTLALAIASGSFVPAVYAEDATTLKNITISASPIHEHEAFVVPSQIDSLNGDEKAELESGSLGEMLANTPGVNNLSAGAQSGKPVIRGMTGERVKVLSNGASTDYQAYGTRHLPNVDPYLAERIEVVRGPQSVLYGSEALGGVVNVLAPEMPFGQEARGSATIEYNSNNSEIHQGVKMGAGSDKFAITVGASIRKGDNYQVPNADTANNPVPGAPADSRPLFVGEVPYTNFQNRAANIGLGYQEDWGQVTLRHSVWHAKQNYLGIHYEGGDSFEAVAAGQMLENQETQLAAEVFQGDWVIKPSWSFTKNTREASHDLPYENMEEDKGTEHYLDLQVERHDWKLAAEHPKIGDFEGEIGIEVSQKEQRLLSGHLTPSADVDKKAVYLFEEADYDRWLVQFGARYDWHDVYAPANDSNEHFIDEGIFDESNNERDFAVWSGSLGATYRLNDDWSLAGNIARGFRAPSIFELYAGGEHGGVQAYQIGNPDLEAETALNTDLSLRWDNGQTQMVATVYQNMVDNYIYLENEVNPDGSYVTTTSEESGATLQVMKAQQTDAVIRGFEFNIDHRWNQQFATGMAMEIIQGRDQNQSRDLPLIPANNLLLKNSYFAPDWQALRKQKLALETKLVAGKDAAGQYEPFSQFDSMPIGTASTKGYALWNLRYSAQIATQGREKVYLNFAVENLFDRAYVDFLDTYKGYILAQGRNIKLNMRVDF